MNRLWKKALILAAIAVIINPKLFVKLVGITLALVSYDPFCKHFALLIAQGHEHSFPVLKILIHSFLNGQIDRRSNLTEKEVTKYPLFRMNTQRRQPGYSLADVEVLFYLLAYIVDFQYFFRVKGNGGYQNKKAGGLERIVHGVK